MIFNSINFFIFFCLVFIIYWFILKRNLKLQNAFLLVVSYIFYGWWDWRFLSLIAFSSILDFYMAMLIDGAVEQNKRKFCLAISITINLALLFFFKYYNFFIDSFSQLLETLGITMGSFSLSIILPVGISFYTFQTMSYTIDVYRREMKPTRDFVSFMAYVSFFPQLVAGPIERAKNLLPQFFLTRTFIYKNAVNGLVFIFWGLFKKIVIADNCAVVVNSIFENQAVASGLELIGGAVLFAFQIYGDFSGYSDIALGTALLLGFNLMVNFRVPYLSRSIAEFWRRWHISLTTWFRDYIYIPLGGSRVSKSMAVRNTLLVFIISGLWHGANWTFIFWGLLNAIFFLPSLLFNTNRNNLDVVGSDSLLPSAKELMQIAFTFCLVCITWIFFRSQSLTSAFQYIDGIFTHDFLNVTVPNIPEGVFLISILVALEWIFRRNIVPFENSSDKIKWIFVAALIFAILAFRYIGKTIEFIYFQF